MSDEVKGKTGLQQHGSENYIEHGQSKLKLSLPFALIVREDNSRKVGETFFHYKNSGDFFEYRYVLREHLIIPVEFSENWNLGRPYVLFTKNGVQTKKEPEFKSKNKIALDIIVEALNKKITNSIKLKERELSPNLKGRLKKQFSKEFLGSIEKKYLYTRGYLRIPFSIYQNT